MLFRSGEGIEELWAKIQEHREFLTTSLQLEQRRGVRRRQEFLETVEEGLIRRLKVLVEKDPDLMAILEGVARKEVEPLSAATEFLASRRFPCSGDWPIALSL